MPTESEGVEAGLPVCRWTEGRRRYQSPTGVQRRVTATRGDEEEGLRIKRQIRKMTPYTGGSL